MKKYLTAAIFLSDHTQDPLLLESIRVLTSRNSPEGLVNQAKRLVESCAEAYIVLYGFPHGNEIDADLIRGNTH